MYIYIYIYIHTYACVCVCVTRIYIYIYIHTVYTYVIIHKFREPGSGAYQPGLEKGVHPSVGSADPTPITMYMTLTLYTYKHMSWILPGVPTRRCMCSPVHVLARACLASSEDCYTFLAQFVRKSCGGTADIRGDCQSIKHRSAPKEKCP